LVPIRVALARPILQIAVFAPRWSGRSNETPNEIPFKFSVASVVAVLWLLLDAQKKEPVGHHPG
jgi:hypothetical protein